MVGDQINLTISEASLEEIIYRQREIATDFDAELSLGLCYTLGSVYNNMINERL